MRTRSALVIASLSLLFTLPLAAHAESTRLVVHVLAHDAKLIGDAAGGAHVVVRDAATGRLLAEGLHLGGTGSTDKIIKEPQVRGETIYDTEGAASYRCALDLDQPTWVNIEASAPLAYPQSISRASSTLLVVPGRDIEGDGIVLELNGLIVNLLSPHVETKLRGGDQVEIQSSVKLLCTCPIFEGSPWDSADYRVEAELWADGKRLKSVPLQISETHNVFAGTMELPNVEKDEPLVAELRIVAGNDAQHNYGMDRAVLKITHKNPE